MGKYLPLHLKFVNGARRTVTSISEARSALKTGQWRNESAVEFRKAEQLLDAAIGGTCRPDVAFETFKELAVLQGIIVSKECSTSLAMLDQMAEIAKISRR